MPATLRCAPGCESLEPPPGAKRLGVRQPSGAFGGGGPHNHRSPIRIHLKVIHLRNQVRLEAINRLDHGGRGRPFKPRRRTPRILAGLRHQPVFHRILMHVIQARQIRPLLRQTGVPENMPNLPPWLALQFINPTGGFHMQHAQHPAQTGGIGGISGRVRDEMIVIRENRPSLQLPAELCRDGQ